jgi:hypothetical protein
MPFSWYVDGGWVASFCGRVQDTPFIVVVGDVDEVPAPAFLSTFFHDRRAAYDALHLDGHGFQYLGMTSLVYGVRHRVVDAPAHTRAFMATDRLARGLAAAPGHLASFTCVRMQVQCSTV